VPVKGQSGVASAKLIWQRNPQNYRVEDLIRKNLSFINRQAGPDAHIGFSSPESGLDRPDPRL
jgi:hypothetical protein